MVFPILRQLHPGIARSINSLFSHLPWSHRFCGNPETVATFDEIWMIFRCFSDCYLYSDFTVRWYHRCWVFVSSAVDCWVRESDVMFSLGLWAELLGSTYVGGGPQGLETLCTNLKSLGSTWCFSCRFWEGSLHIISRNPLQQNFVGSPM